MAVFLDNNTSEASGAAANNTNMNMSDRKSDSNRKSSRSSSSPKQSVQRTTRTGSSTSSRQNNQESVRTHNSSPSSPASSPAASVRSHNFSPSSRATSPAALKAMESVTDVAIKEVEMNGKDMDYFRYTVITDKATGFIFRPYIMTSLLSALNTTKFVKEAFNADRPLHKDSKGKMYKLHSMDYNALRKTLKTITDPILICDVIKQELISSPEPLIPLDLVPETFEIITNMNNPDAVQEIRREEKEGDEVQIDQPNCTTEQMNQEGVKMDESTMPKIFSNKLGAVRAGLLKIICNFFHRYIFKHGDQLSPSMVGRWLAPALIGGNSVLKKLEKIERNRRKDLKKQTRRSPSNRGSDETVSDMLEITPKTSTEDLHSANNSELANKFLAECSEVFQYFTTHYWAIRIKKTGNEKRPRFPELEGTNFYLYQILHSSDLVVHELMTKLTFHFNVIEPLMERIQVQLAKICAAFLAKIEIRRSKTDKAVFKLIHRSADSNRTTLQNKIPLELLRMLIVYLKSLRQPLMPLIKAKKSTKTDTTIFSCYNVKWESYKGLRKLVAAMIVNGLRPANHTDGMRVAYLITSKYLSKPMAKLKTKKIGSSSPGSKGEFAMLFLMMKLANTDIPGELEGQ